MLSRRPNPRHNRGRIPSGLSTIVLDLEASTATKDGSNNVSAWGAFDTASATKPTWSTVASLNNQPAVFFDTNMSLTRSGELVAASSNWTITLAYALDNVTPAANYGLSWGGGSFGLFLAGADPSISQRPGLLNGSLLRVPSGTVTTATPYVFTVRKSGTTYTVRLNGATNSASGTMAAIGLTGDLIMGTRSTFYLRGRIARIRAWREAVSDARLATFEQQLCTTYGATYA